MAGFLLYRSVLYCRRWFWLAVVVITGGCSTSHRVPPRDSELFTPEPEFAAKPEPLLIVPKVSPSNAPPLAPAPPPVPVIPPPNDHLIAGEIWVPLDRWCQAAGYGAPKRILNDVSPTYSFTSTNGTMIIHSGLEVATWRGFDFHLGFAPQMIGGHPYVHALDMRKNILPLLETPAPAANRVIVIDPGHGGTDTGTKNVANGHFEKEFTLDLAKRLQALLCAEGWTVWLTRSNDVYLPLASRVAIAEEHKAGLFLSLHFNSAFPDHQEAGLETFCLTPQGMHSTLTRGYTDNPAVAFPNNKFDVENMQYAARLHRAVLKVNGHADRGVRRARFLTVLQGQNRPALLIEGGYLSNPHEARQIAEAGYREKLAEAIAHELMPDETGPLKIAGTAGNAVP